MVSVKNLGDTGPADFTDSQFTWLSRHGPILGLYGPAPDNVGRPMVGHINQIGWADRAI
jgi:hypothetical protein